MTYVRATWTERPKQDVVRLDRFEIVWSPLSDPVDYPRAAGLAFLAEVLENALPDRAPEDDLFRLALTVAPQLRGGAIPLAATYFALWTTRLMGWMPDLNTCASSGARLRAEPVYYSPMRDGVTNARSRTSGSIALLADAVAMASRILRQPLPALLEEQSPRAAVQQLRRFAVSTLERHLEERLRSARALATL